MSTEQEGKFEFVIDPSGARTGGAYVVRSLEDIRKQSLGTASAFGGMETAMSKAIAGIRQGLVMLGAGFAGMRLASLAKQTVELAARYDELGIGLVRVGKNVGATRGQLLALESALKATGISAIQSRQSILSMIQAEMDLTQASKLARLAQDAAVVGQINSSDALERIVYALRTAQPEMLRTLGLNVSFEQSYAKMATKLNKSVESLSMQDKATARLNATMEAGKGIAGLYEASMTSASKQLRSTERYVQDLQVSLGALFQPAYTAAVFGYAGALKSLAKNTETVVTVLGVMGAAIAGKAIAGGVEKLISSMKRLGETFTDSGRWAKSAGLEKLSNMEFDTLKLARAETVLTAAKVEGIKATRRKAISEVEQAQYQKDLTLATQAHATAVNNEAVAQQRSAVAGLALTNSYKKVTIGAWAATTASNALNAAMSFLGGPVGIAITALGVAMMKFGMAESVSVGFTQKHSDLLAQYEEKIRSAQKAVENLSGAEKKRSDDQKRIDMMALKGGMSQMESEFALTAQAGTGMFGEIKSGWQKRDLSAGQADQLNKLSKELAKTKDVDAYRQGIAALFASIGKLSPSLVALYGILEKNAITYKATGQALKDLGMDFDAFGGISKKAVDVMAWSEEAVEKFKKELTETSGAQDKLSLAQRVGTKTAELHANAAKSAGMELGAFEKAIAGPVSATKALALAHLDLATRAEAATKSYGKLATQAAITKEEHAAFKKSLEDAVIAMSRGKTETELFNDQLAAFEATSKKMGGEAVKNFNALKGALTDAFSQKQRRAVEEANKVFKDFDGKIRTFTDNLLEAEKNSKALIDAQKSGAYAVEDLRRKQESMNKAAELGTTGILQAVVAHKIYLSATREAAAQRTVAVQQNLKDTAEQIKAMNEEAAAYEKGGDAIKKYNSKQQLMALLKSGNYKDLPSALAALAAMEAATERLAKSKVETAGWSDSIQSVLGGLKEMTEVLNGTGAAAVKMTGLVTTGISSLIAVQKRYSEAKKDPNYKKPGAAGYLSAGAGMTVGAFGAGYQAGASFDNKGLSATAGALSGAATGASAGMTFGPWGAAIGAIVGAVAGLVGGLTSSAAKTKQAAAQMEQSRIQLRASLDGIAASMNNDALGNALAAAKSQFAELRKGAEDSYKFKKNEDGRRAAIAEINALEEKRVAQIIKEHGVAMSQAMDEMQIRALVAKGRTADADAMRQQLSDQKELDQARASGYSDAMIEELKRVQLLEREADALKKANEQAQARQDFSLEMTARIAATTGNSELAAIASAESQRTGDSRRAQKMLEDGTINQGQFDEFMRLVNAAFDQALEDRRQSFRDANADLGVRRLAAGGGNGAAQAADDEAFRISQERELRDAMKDTSTEGIAYAYALGEVLAMERIARDEAKKRAEEARVEKAADAMQDLEVRRLRAQGRSQEAEDMAFALGQQREIRDALKDTTAEGVAYAASLREVLDAEKAARDAQKVEEKRLNGLSMDERIARAQGRTGDADAIATEIVRSRELAAAIDDETKARLKILYAIEDENTARAKAKANATDFNSIMAETLRLQGRSLEADRLEFEFQQATFQEELAAKKLAGTITDATYQLGMDLVKLRRDAFNTALNGSMDQGIEGSPAAQTLNGLTTSSWSGTSEDTTLRMIDVEVSQLTVLRSIDSKIGAGNGDGITIQVVMNGTGIVAQTPRQAAQELGEALAPVILESLGRKVGIQKRENGDATI